MQKSFGIVLQPKHAGTFESEIHHPANGAFYSTTPEREILAKKDVVSTSGFMPMKISQGVERISLALGPLSQAFNEYFDLPLEKLCFRFFVAPAFLF